MLLRVRRFLDSGKYRPVTRQAEDLRRIHGDDLPEGSRRTLERFLDRRRSLAARLRYALSGDFYCHQRRDEYWRHGSVCENYAAIECPVYAVGGFVDGYTNAVPRLLAGLSVPRKGLIGPWAHAFPDDALPGPSIGFLQEAVRWFDHWLKGRDTGILREPRFAVYVRRWHPPGPVLDHVEGGWRWEEGWPIER